MGNKNISRFALAAAGLILVSACKKSFLTITPPNQVSSESVNTLAGLQALYNNAFEQLADAGGHYYAWFDLTNEDVRSDNSFDGQTDNASNEAITQCDNFTDNATTSDGRGWTELYGMIGTCNTLIDVASKPSTDTKLTDSAKNQMIASVKFLRALHYFNLVKAYGPVVLTLHTYSTDTAVRKGRAPLADCYKQIITDLTDAISVLPMSYPGAVNQHTRATKPAAQALLAKVYAQEGDYANCLTTCNAVLPALYGGTGTGTQKLVGNFADLFDDNKSTNTTESYFEVQHLGGTNAPTRNFAVWLIAPSDYNLTIPDPFTKFITPTQDLVNDYKNSGDLVRMNGVMVFENNQTDFNGRTFLDNPNHYPTAPTTQIPYLITRGQHVQGGSYAAGGSQSVIFLRLADIILLKAEALNNTGNTGGAIPLVNAIRARVSLAPTTASSQSDVALAILHERRLEFAGQGYRWSDLKRFGADYTVNLMNSFKDYLGNKLYNITKNNLLYAIPISEINSNGAITQNPGY
ncbi:MAG: RagB/SusD family nutrient uptake outer membrane protein [Bacteroidetes bacterium]|nr:RagB/SusD family nutrient uptake outer membrane protein [Bacteroidota bacterium]